MLKLVTKCKIEGGNVLEFITKIKEVGYFTYIDGLDDDEDLEDCYELEVMVFKLQK